MVPSGPIAGATPIPGRWDRHGVCGGRVGERMIEGELVAEPSDVIGLTYTDTDGRPKYCYNSALATCRMQVAGKAFERAELVAQRRAMFEILTDTPHEGVPLLA